MARCDPDRECARLFAGLSFRPVFIVGDHRCGTTLLYQILGATGSFHVLTAYHVIHYGEIVTHMVEGRSQAAREVLAKRFSELGLDNRIIDGVRVTPDLPEEYGFVIDRSRRPRLRPATRERFVEMCRKLRLTGGSDKPLLLKNPWDVLNFTYLKQSFPAAKLILLHRHPVAVVNSQLRAIRSLLTRRNEYVALIAPWYARIFEQPAQLALMRAAFSQKLPLWTWIVPHHVRRATRSLLEHAGELPAADCLSLRYEDLCGDPRGTVDELLRFLGLSPEAPVDYEQWIGRRAAPLLPEVASRQRALLDLVQPYAAKLGYEVLE